MLGASAALLAWAAVLAVWSARRSRTLAARGQPAQAALPAGLRSGSHPRVLGHVLARGPCRRAAHRRAARVRLRFRSAPRLVAPGYPHAGIRPVPGDLQHQPVPVVQARLVLPPVPDDRGRLRRQGPDPVDQGRPPRTHLQSLVVHALGVLAGPARDRLDASHVGTGDRHHAAAAAVHLPADLPGQPARAVPVRRRADDAVGGRDHLRVQRDLRRGRPARYYFIEPSVPIAVFLGMHLLFTDPSTSPRTESGRVDLRRAVRTERRRAGGGPRAGGCADLLRQAAQRAAAEPGDPGDRPRRAVSAAAAVRPGGDRPDMVAAAQARDVHRRLGGALRRHPGPDGGRRGARARRHLHVSRARRRGARVVPGVCRRAAGRSGRAQQDRIGPAPRRPAGRGAARASDARPTCSPTTPRRTTTSGWRSSRRETPPKQCGRSSAR